MLEELPLSGTTGLRIKLPDFFAIFRVEGNHAVRRSGKVQHAINHQRGGLERSHMMPVRLIAAAVRLSHVICPRALQFRNIAAVDLLKRRKTSAARVACIESPFLRGDSGREQKKKNQTPFREV